MPNFGGPRPPLVTTAAEPIGPRQEPAYLMLPLAFLEGGTGFAGRVTIVERLQDGDEAAPFAAMKVEGRTSLECHLMAAALTRILSGWFQVEGRDPDRILFRAKDSSPPVPRTAPANLFERAAELLIALNDGFTDRARFSGIRNLDWGSEMGRVCLETAERIEAELRTLHPTLAKKSVAVALLPDLARISHRLVVSDSPRVRLLAQDHDLSGPAQSAGWIVFDSLSEGGYPRELIENFIRALKAEFPAQ